MPQRSQSFFPQKTRGGNADDLAIVAHELRNSLAIVRGAARLLRAPGSTEMHSAGVVIERHVGQMSRHIDELLDPLRRRRQGQGLLLSRCDLRTILCNAVDGVAADIARRGHRLPVELPPEPVWVQADGARLEQVFSNLLINAAKYTPDGGEISLSIERAGEIVRVRVRDSGVGMAPALLLRVFGLFVQGDVGPSGPGHGYGIGLAVVRAVVEQHGGSVTASSEGLGRGSEFTVTLPVERPSASPVLVAV